MGMKQLFTLLGREGFWNTSEGLSIQVRITDVKQAYGKVRYQITPINGVGYYWTEQKPQLFDV